MATQTLKRLFQWVVDNAAEQALYMAPSNGRTVVVSLYKTNTSGSDITFDLWAVVSGQTVGDNNAIYKQEPILANRIHPRRDIGIILDAGHTLYAQASAASALTISGYGIEILD